MNGNFVGVDGGFVFLYFVFDVLQSFIGLLCVGIVNVDFVFGRGLVGFYLVVQYISFQDVDRFVDCCGEFLFCYGGFFSIGFYEFIISKEKIRSCMY